MIAFPIATAGWSVVPPVEPDTGESERRADLTFANNHTGWPARGRLKSAVPALSAGPDGVDHPLIRWSHKP